MKRLLGFATLLAGLTLATVACACSVPVFRYALERWKSDPYELLVFLEGPLSTEQEALVEGLTPRNEDGLPIANLEVRRVSIDAEMDEATREIWSAQAAAGAPWLVVLPPAATRSDEVAPRVIWGGPLDASAATVLHDSPLRHELAEQLLGGETAVWVLLESGDQQRDDAAFALLEAQLAKATAELKLPELDEQDLDDGLLLADPTTLRVSFSLRRLSRTSAEEAPLVSMLLATEPDLAEYDAPMAFPIFGRARVLYALVGEGINPDTIEIACRELIGPCTCQIKEQNPGADLLMAIDWDARVSMSEEEERPLPALPGLPAPAAEKGKTVAAVISTDEATASREIDLPVQTALAHGGEPTTGSSASLSVIRNTLVTAGVAALGIAVAGLILLRRRG